MIHFVAPKDGRPVWRIIADDCPSPWSTTGRISLRDGLPTSPCSRRWKCSRAGSWSVSTTSHRSSKSPFRKCPQTTRPKEIRHSTYFGPAAAGLRSIDSPLKPAREGESGERGNAPRSVCCRQNGVRSSSDTPSAAGRGLPSTGCPELCPHRIGRECSPQR